MIDRRTFIGAVTGGLLAAPLAAEAQQAAKIDRIGYLALNRAAGPHGPEAFLQGLRDLGYVEGRNLVFEFRWAGGDGLRLADLATELAHARVDVIMAFSTQGVRAAKRATETIPIVFVAGNPVLNGVVPSLAHPGGNATGVALQVIGPQKASQVLKEAVPKIARVVYLYDPRSTPPERFKTLEGNVDLKGIGLTVRPIPFGPSDDAQSIAKTLGSATDGLVLENSPSLQCAARQLCTFAELHRLPALGSSMFFAEAGCLIGYGEDQADWTRQMATIVHKVLKGAKPADIPVEQPVTVKVVVNLKTAKALGLAIPQSLLLRADQLIE